MNGDGNNRIFGGDIGRGAELLCESPRRMSMASNSLTITDNRTGKVYDIPITNGAIRAMDLRHIRTGPDDFGLLSYDPAFMNTASTTSRITEIRSEEHTSELQSRRDLV